MSSTSPATNWRPSTLGKLVGGSGDWSLDLEGASLLLRMANLRGGSAPDVTTRSSISEVTRPSFRKGLLWGTVTFELRGLAISLKGMRNRDAASLVLILDTEVRNYQQLQQTAKVVAWASAFRAAIDGQYKAKGWLNREFRNYWQGTKPEGSAEALLANPGLDERLGVQPGQVRLAVELWAADLRGYCALLNEQHVLSEAVNAKGFFDTIERSPLTDDQIRAVVCLDNRVQVIASAGSGKTSTMVAKAGYVLHRKLVPAEKILLLAFNTDAAKELEQRIHERLLPLGLDGGDVKTKTFHAFGLEIIGQATGRKPSVAPWVQDGADQEKLRQIVDKLRDTDPGFRRQWDLFRLVLSRGFPEFGPGQGGPGYAGGSGAPTGRPGKAGRQSRPGAPTGPPGNPGYAAKSGVGSSGNPSDDFRTLQGEVVKSHGERLIADWLFYNGVDYVYERPYEHDTVDAAHSQYHPDFYYPGIGAYHEHFALDHQGLPPPEFTGYLDGVHWKRALHRQFGTTLLETTMSELWDGRAFDRLSEQLTARGITLNPNPDRPSTGPEPMRNEQLIRTFRTFLIHAKSNRLSGEQLRERLTAWSRTPAHFRHSVFLNLFDTIRAAWDQELAQSEYIDFEDMLSLAADHVEAGRWDPGYEMVMVDEMQDASHARARLAHALVNAPGRMLFAVGDDWQSINGFAGADISVMTDFSRWFGEAEIVRLERTFRSPQSISSLSSAFVQKNPAQLRKSVVSSAPEYSPYIVAVALSHAGDFQRTVRVHLEKLAARVAAGEIPSSTHGVVTVLVLCRYRKLVQEMRAAIVPASGNAKNFSHLDIRIHTIHGAKGLEADYVIIPGLTKGSMVSPAQWPTIPYCIWPCQPETPSH